MRSAPTCRLHSLSCFAQNNDGDVAILFGLMALVLFMSIGVAVDYGRWVSAHNQTVAAADAAVLAAARSLQTNSGDQTAAIKVAQTFYAQAVTNRLKTTSDTINFVVADNGTSIVTTGNAKIAPRLWASAASSHCRSTTLPVLTTRKPFSPLAEMAKPTLRRP
jgi:Flp pilus assembly protein TadG